MKTCIIKKFDPAQSWEQIPALKIDTLLWTEHCDITACGQISYSDKVLLVHLCAEEKDIRAEHSSLLGAPCEDSCLEFFFSPAEGDTRYFTVKAALSQ